MHSAYSSANLEFDSFHLRKFAGKTTILKMITILSHQVSMNGQSFKVFHSQSLRWQGSERYSSSAVPPLHGPMHTPDNNRWDTTPV